MKFPKTAWTWTRARMSRVRRQTVLRILSYGAAVTVLILAIYAGIAATYDLKEVGQIPERSLAYDVHDRPYTRLYGENRVVIPLSHVSPVFIKALLAREDTRFYEHHGLDFWGIFRAVLRDLLTLSAKEGASTLTQQLARNSYHLGTFKPHRKLLEAMIALRIEKKYTKAEIIEHYVNRIYFGAGVYGIETASQVYFGKSCSALNLSECATLAGLIRSPNRFSPFKSLKIALRERDTVLKRMTDLKMISKNEAERARASRLRLAKQRSLPFQENYAMDAIRRVLNLVLQPDQVDKGGLKVFTTIDADLQRAASKALDAHLTRIESEAGYKNPTKAAFTKQPHDADDPTDYLQGALVAIDNRTGGICALVGGRDYQQSKFNRALQARRQIGSSFKPFVYAAAFQHGLDPDSPVDDSPLRPEEMDRSWNGWTPSNSDNTYTGERPASYGLIHSRNTMSVRIGQMVGLDEVRDLIENLNLCNDVPKVPSLYLGGFEASPKDLTAAYTLFPNHGVLKQPFFIRRIEDVDGNILFSAQPEEKEPLDSDAAITTSGIMEEVLKSGTAARARSMGFRKVGAGKTGTTNDYKDAWFVGYTSSLTCGVWVGFDRPQTIMQRGYGATLALPVWVDFMNHAPESDYPAETFDQPYSVGRRIENTFEKIGRGIIDFFGGGRKSPKN